MAAESPDKAMNNADNFKWFVYYLNACSDAATDSSSSAPCSLSITPSGSYVRVVVQCTAEVKGLALKVVDSTGRYLQNSLNYGTVGVGNWVLQSSMQVASYAYVKLFYERSCEFWEAIAGVSSTTTVSAVKVLDLDSVGGSPSPPPVTTTTTTEAPVVSDRRRTRRRARRRAVSAFPCELTLDTDVTLVGGAAGFKILVRCTQDISDFKLAFDGPVNYSDRNYGTLPKDNNWRLFTHEMATFGGYLITISGGYSGTTGSTSKRLPSR
jgi:hypothetical protein